MKIVHLHFAVGRNEQIPDPLVHFLWKFNLQKVFLFNHVYLALLFVWAAKFQLPDSVQPQKLVLVKIEQKVGRQVGLGLELKLPLDHFQNEKLKVDDRYETLCFDVEVGPDLSEFFRCVRLDLLLFVVELLLETFKNNCDEQIQHDECHEDHKTDKVRVAEHWVPTPLDSLLLSLFIGLLVALKVDWPLPWAVLHQVIPTVASRDPEQGYEGRAESLEVGVLIEWVLQFDGRKEVDAHYAVQELKKKK